MAQNQYEQLMQGANMLVNSVGTLNTAIGSAKLNKKNRKFAAEQQQKLMDYNAAENEKAYQRNLEMWNKVNAYNSPKSQLQRLVDAGLNPNLAYGNVSTGNADAAPQAQPNQGVPIDSAGYSDYYEPLMQGFRDMASNSLAYATTAKTLTENKKTSEEYIGLKIQNSYMDDVTKTNLRKLIADAKLSEQGIQKQSAETDLITQNFKNAQETFKQLKIQTDRVRLQYDNEELEYFEKIQTRDARIKGVFAREYVSIAQSQYIDRQLFQQLRMGDLSIEQMMYSIMDDRQFFKLLQDDPKFKDIYISTIKNEHLDRANLSTLNAFISSAMAGSSKEISQRILSWYTSWLADVSFVMGQTGMNLGSFLTKAMKIGTKQ